MVAKLKVHKGGLQEASETKVTHSSSGQPIPASYQMGKVRSSLLQRAIDPDELRAFYNAGDSQVLMAEHFGVEPRDVAFLSYYYDFPVRPRNLTSVKAQRVDMLAEAVYTLLQERLEALVRAEVERQLSS